MDMQSVKEQNDSQIVLMSSSEDVPGLGDKVFKVETQARLERNKRIEEAKRVAKKATEYTLETRAVVKAAADKDSEKSIDEEMKLSCLKTMSFKESMLAGANIRLNLAEYVTCVRWYNQLRGTENVDILNRLKPIEGKMDIFTKRINAYLNNNGVDIDGNGLKDNEKTVTFGQEDAEAFNTQLQKDSEAKMPKEKEPENNRISYKAEIEKLDMEMTVMQDLIDMYKEEGNELEKKYLKYLLVLSKGQEKLIQAKKLIAELPENAVDLELYRNYEKKYTKEINMLEERYVALFNTDETMGVS